MANHQSFKEDTQATQMQGNHVLCLLTEASIIYL